MGGWVGGWVLWVGGCVCVLCGVCVWKLSTPSDNKRDAARRDSSLVVGTRASTILYMVVFSFVTGT